MPKEKIERSEAILKTKRNTRKGLQTRNKILLFLNKDISKKYTTNDVMDGVGLSYASVSYHLNSMFQESVVKKEKIEYRVYWQITGLGQQTIKKWMEDSS